MNEKPSKNILPLTNREMKIVLSGNLSQINTLIKSVAGKRALSPQQTKQALWRLLPHFNHAYVPALKNLGCDFKNTTLYDGNTVAHYLSYFGRLTPRLISSLSKAGCDLSATNDKGHPVAYYLAAELPLVKEVVASLKECGVDFKKKNEAGICALDGIVASISKNPFNGGDLIDADTVLKMGTHSPRLRDYVSALIRDVAPHADVHHGARHLAEHHLSHFNQIKRGRESR